MEEGENKGFIYQFGKFALDPHEKTLSENGVSIHLPAKEFDTLLLLIENNGHALSKEEMLREIWRDSFVEEGNLAKQISRLRKIFNTNGQNLIETLPKHGYRFTADIQRVYPQQEETIIEKRTVKRLTVEVDEETDKTRRLLPPAKTGFFNRAIFAILGIALLAVVLAIWYWNRPNPTVKINSMAVLPLKPLNEGESNKALGLGMTDALITKIGSLRSVMVRPTSAIIKFADADALEAGKKLNVDAVLEGTIQQSEGRIRINARLLRTANGEQIWAENFDQPESEIFALQDALSNKITKTLAFELNKAEMAQLAARPTENADAYEKYLRGRFYQSQNDEKGMLKSIEFYEQAIVLDPKFAEPYTGIADANVLLYNFGLRPADEVVPKARQAVNKALQLNPNLPDAYNALSLIQFLSDRDWKAAEQSLKKAIELNPNNANAYLRYGYFLINVGEFDEALTKLEKARELNPLSPIVQSNIGLAYMSARRYPQAIEKLEKVVAENPQFSMAHRFLGTAYEGIGDADKGFAAHVNGLEIQGNKELANRLRNIKEKDGLGAAYQLWIDESLKTTKDGYTSPLDLAWLYAATNNREETVNWLEKAVDEGEQTISQIKYISRYDFVRDDKRFKRLVERIEFKK